MIQTIQPSHFSDYQLIDSGNQYKLEQFGSYILSRPEPQAIWAPSMSNTEWSKLAHATFVRDKSSPERGQWNTKSEMPDQWKIKYSRAGLNLVFRLGMTAFKHVGIFPEQAHNWDYIFQVLSSIPKGAKVLNLFAYTGGASLAASAAGAEVTHVDSVKQVVSWAKENMLSSRLNGIRWIVEDAVKFVSREVRRGSVYQGIILDPPAYGRGADGEKWVLEDHLHHLLGMCKTLLAPKDSFLILNLYAMGFSPLIAETMLKQYFDSAEIEIGELYFEDKFNKKLPLGVYARFKQ
jgi:23S rRNA (cytosine1962-C5)-methyltransferase